MPPQIKSAESGRIVSKKTADPKTTYKQTQSAYAVLMGGLYMKVLPSAYQWVEKKNATLFARKKDLQWAKDLWGISCQIKKVNY